MISVSYVLPLRAERTPSAEFIRYVNGLADWAEVLLVDGSPGAVYKAIDAACVVSVRHLPPDGDLAAMRNGKVRGALTGLRHAAHEKVIIADDDVRYTLNGLVQVAAALDEADVVRPQNYFEPQPWHARLDTARSLMNRLTGGDWPGTLGVRRSTMARSGGYDGDVLFENLELVRTVEAVGGHSLCRDDLFIKRLPPSAHHFWRQRVRQAYDEFARPTRLLMTMVLLPLFVGLLLLREWVWIIAVFIVVPTIVAELGRRREHGERVFPWTACFWAPAWIAERALCVWAAVGARVAFGGIPYSGGIIRTAANSSRQLKERHRGSDECAL